MRVTHIGVLILFVAFSTISVCNSLAESPEPEATSLLYDTNPEHPLNLLHRLLFIRVAGDGRVFGDDSFEPLLWYDTPFLSEGPRYTKIIEALDRCLALPVEKLHVDPLRRALLQHDLWTVFELSFQVGPEYAHNKYRAVLALRWRLVELIRLLALDAEAIKHLPDSYELSRTKGGHLVAFDPRMPRKAFLPDLFSPDSEWIAVGAPTGRPAAISHLQQAGNGRSSFVAFIKLPGGRSVTQKYIETLNAFPEPVQLLGGMHQHPPDPKGRRDFLTLSPNLPQFPSGTQVALVRTKNLIDKLGNLLPSRLVETVQFRVYVRVGNAALAESPQIRPQEFFQFDLRRTQLLKGVTGGLVPLTDSDHVIEQAFVHQDDFFTRRKLFPDPQSIPRLASCTPCHTGHGIYSVNTFNRMFSRGELEIPKLEPSKAEDEVSRCLHWKRREVKWGLFSGYWERGTQAPSMVAGK